ncbi:MAG: hypothetical protein COB19_00015 [Porticoccus sp.]|nr:MAG: hypothetical protein COB19_00015 [Porticoccus sp.]
MVLQREKDMSILNSRFAILRNSIETSVGLNLTSLTVVSENFFRDLLNMLLRSKFVNLNVDLGNAAAIDLGDISKGMCIQVTATPGKSKIVDTVDKFVKYNLNGNYTRLIVLITTKKLAYQVAKISDTKSCFTLDVKKDVWDWTDLLKLANDLPQEELTAVRSFVEEGIQIEAAASPVNEFDRKLFAEFCDLIANRGEIRFFKENDFVAQFAPNRIAGLREFVETWDDAVHVFNDQEVEAKREKLYAVAKELAYGIARYTTPTIHGMISVWPNHVDHNASTDWIKREAKILNDFAAKFVAEHEVFISIGREKLG